MWRDVKMANEKSAKLNVSRHTLVGVVHSAKMKNTVTVRIERRVFIRKYERYSRRYSMLKAHNPDSMSAKEGDKVRIAECRPLSKTKHFVVVEKM